MKNMKETRKGLALACMLSALLVVSAAPAFADDEAKAKATVEKALKSLNDFSADPDMGWFRSNAKKAQGLFILPTTVRAGFVFGASGGTGVFLARDKSTGKWSSPAFYHMGSGSFGLQIGVESSEMMLMAMTEKGVNALLSTKAQLGTDLTVAAGPVGAGAKAATTDILSFARSKGVYGGVSAEGAIIKPADGRNHAYYGKPVTPPDILIKRSVSNKHAAPLIAAVTKVAAK
jgi:lipid-binding SYLF domain-containing protein